MSQLLFFSFGTNITINGSIKSSGFSVVASHVISSVRNLLNNSSSHRSYICIINDPNTSLAAPIVAVRFLGASSSNIPRNVVNSFAFN